MPRNDDFRLDLPEIPPPWKKKPGDKVYRVPSTRPWHVPLPRVAKHRSTVITPVILIYGFAALIAIGTILLLLPVANNSGQFTSPVNAFFTATSAVCVTGLVVVDTADYWSSFGQGVILALIQIGGLGFMTSATILFILFGRRIGLKERRLIGSSLGLEKMGGLVKLVKRMAVFTLVIELIGAAVFYSRFSMENPPEIALWKSIFHSVSAFNQAGFDLFGNFRSITEYQTDTLMILATGALVILGGISFVVVADIGAARRFGRLHLDSKIVLTVTAALLVLGTGVFLLAEYSNHDTLGPLSAPYKVLNAFFHSITPRSSGFSTIDVSSMADYSLFFTILLMFVGGAAGSTAGGIKVNTFGMLIAAMWSSLRGREHAGAFGREFTSQHIQRALALVMLALGLVSVVVFILTVTEDFRFLSILFETFSAFGTVGLSTGITPDLSIAGKLIISVTMFIGRLGPLILALSLIQRQLPSKYRYPQDEVRIG
ncbi:MAG: Trk family potassium uptake protein [Chloroflexi bacterium]|nr:Trk family potassium uptake protein [Chloroflexota bacterium]